MENNQLDMKQFAAAGEAAGRAFAIFYQAFIDGYADQMENRTAEATVEECEEETPKDCINCWCNECENLDACVVEKEAYTKDQMPMPCDGCTKGKRWMPKENEPCENFKPAEPRK